MTATPSANLSTATITHEQARPLFRSLRLRMGEWANASRERGWNVDYANTERDAEYRAAVRADETARLNVERELDGLEFLFLGLIEERSRSATAIRLGEQR